MFCEIVKPHVSQNQQKHCTLSEFNLLFQGLSRRLAASALQNYLRGCRAQVQDSLRHMWKTICAGAGCVCADCHVHPEEQVVVRPLAAHFLPFPRLSATFRTFGWRSRRKSGNYPHNFCKFSATFRKFLKCSVHCMGVVALRSGACGAQLKPTRWKVWLLFWRQANGGFATTTNPIAHVMWTGNAMHDNNQVTFMHCWNAMRLGSGWEEKFGALNKRRTMPKKTKNIKDCPSSACGTQIATATKGANFRKCPLQIPPKRGSW